MDYPGAGDTALINSKTVTVASNTSVKVGILNLDGGKLSIDGTDPDGALEITGSGGVWSNTSLELGGPLTISGDWKYSRANNASVDGKNGGGTLIVSDGGTFEHASGSQIKFRFGPDIEIQDGGTIKFSADADNAIQMQDDTSIATIKSGGMVIGNAPNRVDFNSDDGIISFESGAIVEVRTGELKIDTKDGDTLISGATLGSTLNGGIWRIFDGTTLKIRAQNTDITTIGPDATIDIRGTGQFVDEGADRIDNIQTVAGTLLMSDRTYDQASGSAIIVTATGTIGGNNVTYADTLNIQGTVSPGMSVGEMTGDANVVLNSTSVYDFEINDAAGATGGDVSGNGWDNFIVSGNLDFSGLAAGDIDLLLSSLTGTTAGDAANFDPSMSYEFPFLDYGTLDDPNALGASAFLLNIAGFSNDTMGGTFGVTQNINDGFFAVTFSPGANVGVPEPASIAIWTLLGLIAAGYAWRRRG